MKVTIIKVPNFEQAEKKAHELLYRIISKKIQENEAVKPNKEVI
ncbi:hypothetical protein [Niallia sp. 03190]